MNFYDIKTLILSNKKFIIISSFCFDLLAKDLLMELFLFFLYFCKYF